jgi:dienelactone hydrolase
MSEKNQIDRRSALLSLGAAGALFEDDTAGPPRDQPREARPVNADIGSLYPAIESMARRGGYTHSFLSGRFSTFEAFRTEGRAVVFEALGPRPNEVDPRPEVAEQRDMGEYLREKVVFSTTPDFRVPAFLLIPKGLRAPAPAIVDLHSHGGMFLFGKEKVTDLGRNHPAMVEYHRTNYGGRPTATALVRRGYVVITCDAFPFGERRLMMDEDLRIGWDRSNYTLEDVQRLNATCRAKESTLAKSLVYAGATWPGITAWDDIRTVDYLCTRPEVDPKRIGCLGVSFGGWRSLFLGGLDQRITANCVVGFMSAVKPMIRRHMDTHSFVHFVPGLHRRLDLPDVAALRVPKPLLVLQCRRDGLFPLAGMQEAVKNIEAIYAHAGAPRSFTARFYDLPHVFNVAMQEEAFDWLDRMLKH